MENYRSMLSPFPGITSYRQGTNMSSPRIDLAAVELLDALISSADEYIGRHCPKESSCVLS
jgi:hypothetical protein